MYVVNRIVYIVLCTYMSYRLFHLRKFVKLVNRIKTVATVVVNVVWHDVQDINHTHICLYTYIYICQYLTYCVPVADVYIVVEHIYDQEYLHIIYVECVGRFLPDLVDTLPLMYDGSCSGVKMTMDHVSWHSLLCRMKTKGSHSSSCCWIKIAVQANLF